MSANTRRDYLFGKYLEGKCSDQEIRELVDLLDDTDDAWRLIRQSFYSDLSDVFGDDEVEAFTRRVGDRLIQSINSSAPFKRSSLPKNNFVNPGSMKFWLSVAAILLLVFGVTLTLYFAIEDIEPEGQLLYSSYGADVLPGGNRASLRLADGRDIKLEEGQKGIIMSDSVRYVDGTRIADNNETNGFYVLSTPKGGQYKATLPDGTDVWLNAASSLTYPSKFSGDERVVQLTGEAFFDVSPDVSKPFLVRSGHQEVRVLGTQFNINAYEGYLTTATTLVSGAIQVKNLKSSEHIRLSPGKQSIVMNDQLKVNSVKAGVYTSWKDGIFSFRETELREVMNQLSRWYDVEIRYQTSSMPENYFFGDIRRNKTLAEALDILKQSGVNFRIEYDTQRKQNQLIVLP